MDSWWERVEVIENQQQNQTFLSSSSRIRLHKTTTKLFDSFESSSSLADWFDNGHCHLKKKQEKIKKKLWETTETKITKQNKNPKHLHKSNSSWPFSTIHKPRDSIWKFDDFRFFFINYDSICKICFENPLSHHHHNRTTKKLEYSPANAYWANWADQQQQAHAW